jgi:hypothetical protein
VDAITWHRDYDGDTWGDEYFPWTACSAPSGYVYRTGDCDDFAATTHPGATEVCDPYNIDEDCDGGGDDYDPEADEGLEGMSTWYPDSDGDDYGDEDYGGWYRCDPPTSSWVTDHTDCDDGDGDTYPGATEVCDAADNDEDCDGGADDDDPEGDATGKSTWYRDWDGDAYGDSSSTTSACDAPSGYVADSTDCDDYDADTNPGAEEYCDSTDHDCDGIDTHGAVDMALWYLDSDEDGHGHPYVGWADAGCGTPPTGYALCEGCDDDDFDCDDGDDEVYPGAHEDCTDAIDNDCDGYVDVDDLADCTCPENGDLGSETGYVLALDWSSSLSADYSATCASTDSAPDAEYTWTAPYDGCYIFDTRSSFFDTVLMLYDECYGTELACNDDVDDPYDEDFPRSDGSRLSYPLDADESVLAVVDGYGSSEGAYALSITRSNLSGDADEDLGSDIGYYVYAGTTWFGGSDYGASCGASSDSPDILLHWTAPTAGYYAFWVEADEFDSVLSLYQGSECTSTSDDETEVACTDTYGWGGGEVLARSMDDGEQILIRVAGYGAGAYGDFAVHIFAE